MEKSKKPNHHATFAIPVTGVRTCWAIMRTAKSTAISFAIVFLVGCHQHYQTSDSVDHARKRGLLIADYVVPDDANLGEYQVLEVWAETDRESGTQQLIVRLKGPHHGTEPRVQIAEPGNVQYLSIWSKRNGPPYEVWAAPDPIPEVLKLQRGNRTIELTCRHN
jgi:hypothetical protein